MPGRARVDDLGPLRVVLHRRDALERLGRVADDAAVGRDEGDARAEQLAEAIGFLVELGDRGSGAALRAEQVRGQPRFGDQRRLDPRVDLAAHRRREQHAGDGERDDRGRERGEEELGLEAWRGTRSASSPCARARDRRACSRTA